MLNLFYMSDSEYKEKLKKIERKNASARRKKMLREANESRIKLPSTTKVVLWIVIAYCIHLLWFIEKRIEATYDSSSLVALIGVLTTLISVVCGYFKKSAKENSKGGITYEMAMRELNEQNEEPVG